MTQRYDRQMRYEPFGKYGQAQLQQTHVMIIGAGALGSQCAELLGYCRRIQFTQTGYLC